MRRLCLTAVVSLVLATPLASQESSGPHYAYRIEHRTEYSPQPVTAYRLEYDTVYTTKKVVVQKPVWEDQEYVRTYTVRKPVETVEYRDEQVVTYEPQTTCTTQYVDQGGWETHYAYVPGPVRTRLRLMPGGYAVDPVTGVTYFQRGGLVWAPEQRAGAYTAHNVWRPNVVAVNVPQTTYVQKVVTRKVPVTVCNYVDEVREERVPTRVCKMVAVEEEVRVPQCVERRIPVTYTQYVPRVVTYRTAIDACGNPIPEVRVEKKTGEPTPAGPEEKAKSSDPDKPKDPKLDAKEKVPAEKKE